MIFDDHDVHDDWNTSEEWVEQMRAEPWWQQRITSALASYWIYQHIGNFPPAELECDPLLRQVMDADDAAAVERVRRRRRARGRRQPGASRATWAARDWWFSTVAKDVC